MKASRYNLLLPASEPDHSILCNTLYGSLSTWTPEERTAMQAALSKPDSPDAGPDVVAALADLKYLVPDDLDELEIVRSRKRAGVGDKNRLDVTIMPTLDCNFACPYCYEARRASRMTEETVRSICQWLEDEIPRHKLVFLIWFGGEPLLDSRRLAEITAHVKRVAESNGVATLFNVTTNGYLLTPDRARELVELGILDFQITIDGPQECHDALRVLRSGAGTFDRVFENTVALARSDPRVKITLRVNFNHENLSGVPRLLEAVPPDVRPQMRLSLEPVFGDCSLNATQNMKGSFISDSVASCFRLAAELGFDVANGVAAIQAGKLVYCGAEREHYYILNYNGDVFKCGVSHFESCDRVGRIDSEGRLLRDDKAWGQFVSTNLFEAVCEECVYLPLCMGGCRAARLKAGETGSFCALIPTNTAYVLQQIAYGNFGVVASQARAEAED
jgi:uncharacterized protein